MSYLDDVSSKGAPKPLLFGVVELIVGQIPSIFNLWLGHILDTSKKEPNMTHIIHFPNTCSFFLLQVFYLFSSYLLRFIFDDTSLSQQNATFFQCCLFLVFFGGWMRGSLFFFIWNLWKNRSKANVRFHVHFFSQIFSVTEPWGSVNGPLILIKT